MKTVLTIFAGRKENLVIQRKYLNKAIELGLIDEVHYWNYTRNREDETFLRQIANLRRTSSLFTAEYTEIFPQIENHSFCFSTIASNDIHICLHSGEVAYEIVLGGWNNTRSVIRESTEVPVDFQPNPSMEWKEIASIEETNVLHSTEKRHFRVDIQKEGDKQTLRILKCEEQSLEDKPHEFVILESDIKEEFAIRPYAEGVKEHVYMKTGHQCTANIWYEPMKNDKFYFMDTAYKAHWTEYYNYYVHDEYRNDLILKCDDDILFMDLTKLEEFKTFIKTTEYDAVFANIINNGVAAYFQQTKYQLLPKALDEYEFPKGGVGGTLLESGQKANRLHDYFLKNYDLFLHYNYQQETIPITTRFSINFFGMKGSNWYKIKDIGYSDEAFMTFDLVQNGTLRNCIYSAFYVSHFSFYSQKFDKQPYLQLYSTLFDTIYPDEGTFLEPT